MGAEGLEPSRLLRSTDFHSPVTLVTATGVEPIGFENWTLPLPST